MDKEWYKFLLYKSRNENIPFDSLKLNPKVLIEFQKRNNKGGYCNGCSGGCTCCEGGYCNGCSGGAVKDSRAEYYREIGKSIIKVIEGDDTGYLLDNLIRSLESV